MSAVYFWTGTEMKTVDRESVLTCTDAGEMHLLDMLCVDTNWDHDKLGERYGKFLLHRFHGVHWQNIPLEDFPPEFRTHLLLLGVS